MRVGKLKSSRQTNKHQPDIWSARRRASSTDFVTCPAIDMRTRLRRQYIKFSRPGCITKSNLYCRLAEAREIGFFEIIRMANKIYAVEILLPPPTSNYFVDSRHIQAEFIVWTFRGLLRLAFLTLLLSVAALLIGQRPAQIWLPWA